MHRNKIPGIQSSWTEIIHGLKLFERTRTLIYHSETDVEFEPTQTLASLFFDIIWDSHGRFGNTIILW